MGNNRPGKARVAAIARETLDEAFAFAEARGRAVSGYSSLADPSDFPRLPDFGGMGFETEEDFGPPVAFTSSRPRTAAPSERKSDQIGQSGPVVEVDDSTPVMQLETRTAPPLDPGLPVSPKISAPRVSTDIAASTVSDKVGATLSPKAVTAARKPRSAGMSTLMIFAVAFLLTVGIAFLVWAVLPLSPGRDGPALTAPVNGTLENTTPETETAAAPTEETEAVQEAEPETEIAALPEPEAQPEITLPDLPAPVFLGEAPTIADTPDLTTRSSSAPRLAVAAPPTRSAPDLMSAAALTDALPGVARAAPLPPRPAELANLLTTPPQQGPDPREIFEESTDSIYIASIENSELAFDAIALPAPSSLVAGALPDVGTQPAPVEETDPMAQAIERAVIASIEPDAPAQDTPALTEPEAAVAVEPAAPQEEITQAETEPETDEPQTLRPTALAAAIPEIAPRARPSGFVEEIERDTFGGRTREELGQVRPGARPESDQIAALQAAASSPPSALAVATAPPPRLRPRDFDAIVAQTLIQREAVRVTSSIAVNAPDTSSAVEAALQEDAESGTRPQDTPRLAIPSNASVSRQATIQDAIRLNRINLVGVYGAPSSRRALVRLSSGRYIKVKVGDSIDGGTVSQITEGELLYNKGSRLLSLSLPQG